MHSIHTAPKTGVPLLLIMRNLDGNDWCVVGFYHSKRGWVLAADSTPIHAVGWEGYYGAQENHPHQFLELGRAEFNGTFGT